MITLSSAVSTHEVIAASAPPPRLHDRDVKSPLPPNGVLRKCFDITKTRFVTVIFDTVSLMTLVIIFCNHFCSRFFIIFENVADSGEISFSRGSKVTCEADLSRRPCLDSLVHIVMFWQFCPLSPVKADPSRLTCPSCPHRYTIPTVLSWLSCHGALIPVVLS